MNKENLSVKEQIECMFHECKDKYPDAIDWLTDVASRTDLDSLRTKEERFMDILSGNDVWIGNPYDPWHDNFVELIKWYRGKTGKSLKEAKADCENYIVRQYSDLPRALANNYR